MPGDPLGGFVGWPGGQQDPRVPFMHGQDGLTVFGKQDEVGFPMAGGLAIGGGMRPFGQGNTAFDEGCGAAASSAAEPALALAARQIAAPAIVLGAGDLGVDEAVDALVADDLAAGSRGRAGRRPVRGTSLWPNGPGQRGAGRVRVRGESPTSAAPPSALERNLAYSRRGGRDCASAPEKSSMARDPELPRFAGSIAHRLEAGQSRIGLPKKAARTAAPWQHPLNKVLHFVCELRGPIRPIADRGSHRLCGYGSPPARGRPK